MSRPPCWIYRYITETGLDNLKYYKYTGTDLSILAELFFRRFWEWCMKFMPLWLAPNLVTAIGFAFLISNFIVGVLLCGFSSSCECHPGSWYFFFCAWNTFFYQLMDNLDGKQARRTHSSSALGELFDHGCDSLYIASMSICLSTALQASPWYQFFLLSFGVLIFYASHWEEYHTNHLVLGRYANPTEAETAMIILLLIAGIFGPGFYSTPFIGDINLTKMIVFATFGGLLYCLADCSLKVRKWSLKHPAHHRSFPAPIALSDHIHRVYYAVTPILPILIHLSLTTIWVLVSPTNIVSENTVLVNVFNGLISSYLCNELVVCRITKINFTPFRPILLFPLLGVANVLFTSSPFIPEATMLVLLVLALLGVYVFVHLSIVLQLAHHLDIQVFKIPYPPPEKEKK